MRRRRAARLALLYALPMLAAASILARFTSSRCWSIDWHSPAVDELWWRTVPARALPLGANGEFDRAYAARFARAPVVLSGLMDGWPALSRWTPQYFREHYRSRDVEVYYWGTRSSSALDWASPTRIEQMPMRAFIDEVVVSPRPGAQPGYLQESSFLEDDDKDEGGEGGEEASARRGAMVDAERARQRCARRARASRSSWRPSRRARGRTCSGSPTCR